MPATNASAPVATARMPPAASSVATQIRGVRSDAPKATASPKKHGAPADASNQSNAANASNAKPNTKVPTAADTNGDEKAAVTVVREGTLTRRSVNKHLGMHRWKDQDFVLDDHSSMAYYHRTSGALRGQIILSHDTNVRPFPKRKHAFEIATPFVTMVMQAKSNKEMEGWISSLRTVIRALEVEKSSKRFKDMQAKADELKKKNDFVTTRGTHVFQSRLSTFEVDTRYEYLRAVGQGAYGTVIAARDTKTNRLVAIKQVCNAFDSVVDGKRLLREIKLGTFLRHRNICTVIDLMRTPPGTVAATNCALEIPRSSTDETKAKGDVLTQPPGETTTSSNSRAGSEPIARNLRDIGVSQEDAFNDVYLVMDLMESDLQKIIYSAQPLSEEHIQYLMFQLLSAIKYLQSANVIHRDIKPSNVLVNSACELRLCDFGLARGMDEMEEEEMTRYVVTRWYRAPELVLECGTYSGAIDMWSIGCIFAELFCRRPLFPGKSYISQLNAICDIIGTPTEDDMHFVVDSAANFLRSLPEKPRRPWRDLPGLESASSAAIDLLDRLLSFDPTKRINAEDALKHDFLKSYAGLKPISAPQPVDPESLDCNKLSIAELRAKVMTHIRMFRGNTYDHGQPLQRHGQAVGTAAAGGAGSGEVPSTRVSSGRHSFCDVVRPSPVLEESDA